MLYINLNGGGKSHILSDVKPGPSARIVTTVCGLTHAEYEFNGTDDESNVCARCSGKVEETEEVTPAKEVVDTKPDKVVESTPAAEAEKPKPVKK